jgi:hypothetical protein
MEYRRMGKSGLKLSLRPDRLRHAESESRLPAGIASRRVWVTPGCMGSK